MKDFPTLVGSLNESAPPELHQKLSNDIASQFLKVFPNGYVKPWAGKIIGDNTIVVTVGLIGDGSQLTSKIRENDPMFLRFVISPKGDKFVAEHTNGQLSVEPPEGSHLFSSSIKVGFRKTTGDEQKIVKTFERFFSRLRDKVRENREVIKNASKYDTKYFNV